MHLSVRALALTVVDLGDNVVGVHAFTRQPTETAVPRISLMVPDISLAQDLGRMMRAISTTSAKEMLPVCLMFFSFFLSLGGSLRALITRAAAEGITVQVACLFCTVSLTVTRRPFQSLAVALAMSSPIFLGDRPRGPILGAREEAAPTSPPVARTNTSMMALGSILGAMVPGFFWLRRNTCSSRLQTGGGKPH